MRFRYSANSSSTVRTQGLSVGLNYYWNDFKIAGNYSKDKAMVINISGRGEKDLFITAKHIDKNNWINFLREEVSNGE